MVVSMPRKGLTRTEPREMVRIQLKPNDVRSYTRQEAEELIAATPGAFIVGEGPDDADAESEPKTKARSAPNKARQPKAPASKPVDRGQAETKSESPALADTGAETKGE